MNEPRFTDSDLKELRKWESSRELFVQVVAGELGKSDPAPYYESAGLGTNPANWPKAWCGIFCLWGLHEAGLALDWVWEFDPAQKKYGFLYKLPITRSPQPGDIAYFAGKQHHAIVERVSYKLVTTIDGAQVGNTVARRTRSRRKVTAFYSIDPLLGESIPP